MTCVKAQLSIQRSTETPGVLLRLTGELDASSAPELDRVLGELAGQGHPRIVLDLSGLSFVDSAGVSVLIRGKHDAEERGYALVLSRPTPQVQGVFALLGLLRWLETDDQGTAV
jgi:anti-sigma B factor antagonist